MTKSQLDIIIGRRIYLARTRKFFYQTTIAKQLNISASHFSRIESGDRAVYATTLFAIAKELNVPISDFDPYTDELVWAKPQLPFK